MKLDVITLGRCSVDLYGQQVGGRLEDMASFAKYVGGCPANIAVGTARLGLKSGFISRVGDEHMGRFIREQMQREGVDISCLKTDPQRLTALVILGIRDQHHFPLIFYRENCADLALCEEDIDPAYITNSRALLVTGTHFSTPSIDAASRKAMNRMREADGKIIFDIDYRPVLWGLTGHGLGEERFVSDATVTQHLQSLLPLCDIVVGTEEEFHIAGGTTDTVAALREVRQRTKAMLVCKRGALGCSLYEGSIEKPISVKGSDIDVYNVLGAGDAFLSGLLYGHLNGYDWQRSAQFANACGALVVSRHGCAPAMPDRQELEYFLAKGSAHRALRFDQALNHRHWIATRRKMPKQVFALAIDHRSQMEAIADKAKASRTKIGDFKLLAMEAARQVASGRAGFGMLLDDTYGRDALYAAGDGQFWLGRPVEMPGSRPLEFESGEDIGTILREWPTFHIVKCLVFYHPDDPPDLKAKQERTLRRLYEACRNTGHELLIEVIASKHGPLRKETVASILHRLYDLGIKPDWWKLEPLKDAESWGEVAKAIEQGDPFCRGIVILGLEASEERLIESFSLALAHAPVKGFAIGRTIFQKAAEDWFSGKMKDEEAVSEMVQKFRSLVDAWEELETKIKIEAKQ